MRLIDLSARFRCLRIQDRLDRRGVQLRREPVEGEKRGRNLRDLGGRRHRCTPDSGPSCREDACDRVLAREVRRAPSEKALVALERLAPALASSRRGLARRAERGRAPAPCRGRSPGRFLPPDVEGGSPDSGWVTSASPSASSFARPRPLPPRLSRRGRSDRRSRSNRHGSHRSRSLRTAAARPRECPLGCVRRSSRSRSGQLRPRGSGGSRRPRATGLARKSQWVGFMP